MKIAFISDTHNKHEKLNFSSEIYEDVDTIIHSGDFSHNLPQLFEFMEWYSKTPFKNHILIPGNHELCVQKNEDLFYRACKKYDIIGLIDDEVIIDGIKIYGTPWTPVYFNWAYMKDDYLLDIVWDKIPDDTNILVSHGPSYGILDTVNDYGNKINVGSRTLADRMDELDKLKIHIFGHIHLSRGMYKENGISYINASSINDNYNIKKTYHS